MRWKLVTSAAFLMLTLALGGLWRKEQNRREALACLVKSGAIMDAWESPFNGESVDRLTELDEMYAHLFYTPEAICTGEGNGVSQEEIGEAVKTLQPKALMFYTRNNLSADFLSHVRKTKSLQLLDFDGSFTFDDASLQSLSGMPNLVELAIEDSSITAKALPLIPTFPNLKQLGIAGTNLTEKDRAYILENNKNIILLP